MTLYEQNVREIAAEMARESWAGETKWDAIHDKEKYIQLEIINARIAVNHKAESWAAAMRLYCDWHSEQLITDELISLGLIPSPENKI